jgi:hypothetical protein
MKTNTPEYRSSLLLSFLWPAWPWEETNRCFKSTYRALYTALNEANVLNCLIAGPSRRTRAMWSFPSARASRYPSSENRPATSCVVLSALPPSCTMRSAIRFAYSTAGLWVLRGLVVPSHLAPERRARHISDLSNIF